MHATKRGVQIKTSAELTKAGSVSSDEKEFISGETANLHLTNLQGLFDYAISSGRRTGDNPFPKLKRHSDGNQGLGAEKFLSLSN